MMKSIRPIAIYLPQFHPTPENDSWWGKGFTEWTNVSKCTPRFPGHYQPHLPADLGFYDLRLSEIMEAQAAMARENGIEGFCFYHYWFNGRRMLHRPLDNMLASKKPDFPYMLCWANENWTRRWDGKNDHILMGQDYSMEDHRAHMRFLCTTFFADDRYIKVEGRPVFVVYRSELIPDILKCTETWRAEARACGFKDIYLIRIESFEGLKDPIELGFDAAMEFQPNWRALPPREKASIYERVLHKLGIQRSYKLQDKIFDYQKLMQLAVNLEVPAYKYFRCVTPMWDNSARREKNATIFINSSPEAYHQWLEQIAAGFKPYSAEENFLFINAWNEWAEGNHLEPCRKFGHGYLEKTRAVFNSTK